MRIGVVVPMWNYREEMLRMKELSLDVCQLIVWDNSSELTKEKANEIKEVADENGITISAVWRGWSGPQKWNFTEGPETLGLVPEKYRAERLDDLKRGSDFAEMLGVDRIITHMGFLPENPTSAEYAPVIDAIREIAVYCEKKGQYLLFETGQETPVTLLRTIEKVGTGNLGINLDPANLILYGKANPVDAIDVFGKYVMELHGKDGLYPTCGDFLGAEVPIGEGKVRFENLIPRLRDAGFDGNIIIEREISGEKQIEDIKKAKILLEKIIGDLK